MSINIALIFFVYGLAFFSMGLAMLLESGRSPLLAEARVLLPLAFFGFVHGSHEWLEMFLDKSDWLIFRDPIFVSWLRIGLLSVSFSSLTLFGFGMLQPLRRFSKKDVVWYSTGLSLYILAVICFGILAGSRHVDWLSHIDASVRYLLGVVGAMLAGAALLWRAAGERQQGRGKLAVSLRWAGWAFVLYAFTQVVVPPVDAFPANVLNTATFHSLTGIPIQLVRAFCAVVITISLLRAIQATEAERQQQMLAAQKARLDALEQVQQEMIKRQALRQELLRQTVIAQEEERARVARELHDETAQILTAFSLHLAALRDAVPEDSKADQEIDRLQGLSRKMSQGIYNLVRNLRPAQLDDLGLMAALQYLVGEARERMGLEVQLDVEGERYRLDSLAETVFFRVAQEALTNVARHAGTGEAHLQLAFSPQQVTLRVSDKGVGFIIPEETSMPPGWGLVGMRERVESVGGKLNLRSAPGKGTVVEVTIPVKSSNIGDFS